MNLAILLLAFFAPAPASAATQGCERAAAFDQVNAHYGVPTQYAQSCANLAKANQQTAATVSAQKVNMPTLNVSAGGQADQLRGLAQTSAGGAATSAQVAQIATAAQAGFLKTASDAQNAGQQLDQDAATVAAKVPAAQRANYEAYHQQARADFADRQKVSETLAGKMGQLATTNQQAVNGLMGQSAASAAAANNLGGGGVSANTTALLVGGGVIAAGTVGGLYWVGKKTVNHAEDAGHNLIADADQRIEKIIVLATNSATQVLQNAQQTATAILDKAKDGAVALSTEMLGELQGAVGNLSVAGLGKLRDELDSVFQKLISDATAAGKTDLVAVLQKSHQDVYNFLTQQINQRTGSASATSTGTSTGTSTSTATATNTDTSTGTVVRTIINDMVTVQ